MRKPFIIYRRGVSKVYYVAFWDIDSHRYATWKSAGSLREALGSKALHLSPTSKAGATAIASMWLEGGAVLKNDIPLIEYLVNFWKPDSDYIKAKATRKPLSRDYIIGNASAIKHVRKFLEDTGKLKTLLRNTTPGLLESMLVYLKGKGDLAIRRINGVLQAVTVPLGVATRDGLILENPSATISKLPEPPVEREPLTPEEVRNFFSLEWADPRHYAINLLAATTGMRLGECRGLVAADVHEDWINIRGNWQDGEGIKLPKGGKVRAVPVPSRTAAVIHDLIKENPWKNEFVFWGSSKERPIGKRMVALSFKAALQEIKIPDAEIKRRKISFHAWRHWYNSMLRGKVEDHALRRLTGHSSDAMTERYTEITEEQRAAVALLAETLIQ